MTTQPDWNLSAACHLLSRTSFGGTPEQARRLADEPLNAVVDRLIAEAVAAQPPAPPAWVRNPWINTERVYPETTAEERRENHRQTSQRQIRERNDLRCWWLHQMMTCPAPLRELMTLFWQGHFTTEARRMNISQALYQQNAVWRRQALGSFPELLHAVAFDAGMMIYLNLEGSDAAQPNENFARELLELFTLGIGNYTERDIKEIARALTGWTLDAPPGTEKRPVVADAPRSFCRDGLVATFVPEKHDVGSKSILGRTGTFGARDVLDLVAAHPATAGFISDKLIAFFGVNDPQHDLQRRMAQAFMQSKGDIASILKILFTSPEFYSPESRGTLIKSPVHLLVGTCRLLNLEVTPTPSLAQVTAAMGQELFNPPNVKGWPGGRDWISAGTLAVRYHLPEVLFDGEQPEGFGPIAADRNFALPDDRQKRKELIDRLLKFHRDRQTEAAKAGFQVAFDAEKACGGTIPPTPDLLVETLLTRMLVVSPRPETVAVLEEAVRRVAAAEERVRLAARLILMTPEFQLA